MTTSCKQLSELLRASIGDSFRVAPFDDGCRITTPFLLPDNSEITVYLESDARGHYRLSDFGEAYGYLIVNGVTLPAYKAKTLELEQRFRLDLDGGAVEADATDATLSQRFFDMVMAIQELGMLTYIKRADRHKSIAPALEKFFVDHKANYERNAREIGLTPHRVDYRVTPPSKHEVLVYLMDSMDTSRAVTKADAIAHRSRQLAVTNKPIAVVLNDSRVASHMDVENVVSVENALGTAPVSVIRWSNPMELADLLAA